jgi:fructokinase
MTAPTVLGLGELLWDVFPDSRRPGGAPANVAFHAAQLGGLGRIASRVGRDPEGDELVRFLASRGLASDLIQRDDQHPTGRVTVTVSDGQPSFRIHEAVAWDYLAATDDLLAAAAGAQALCFGSLAQRSPTSRATIQECLRVAQGLIVFDVNLRQHWYNAETIAASLAAADVVKLNHDELSILAPLFTPGVRDPVQFAEALRRRFPVRWVVLTRGADGCLVWGEGEIVDVPGTPVDVVDTVGAGDAFTAAFLMGLLRGWPLERTARFANGVGGLVAARPGAMPDIAAEARRLTPLP